MIKKIFFLLSLILFFTNCSEPSLEHDGGTRITLRMYSDIGGPSVSLAADEMIFKLQKRLEVFGVHSTIHRGEQIDELIVELPGKINLARVIALLKKPGKLEFWETKNYGDITTSLDKLEAYLKTQNLDTIQVTSKKDTSKKELSLKDQIRIHQEENNPQKLHPFFSWLESSNTSSGPLVGYALISDTAKVNEFLAIAATQKFIDPSLKFLWTLKPVSDRYGLIVLKKNKTGHAYMGGDIIADAKAEKGQYNDQAGIWVMMTDEARFTWQVMTRDNIGNSIAIVLDDVVCAFPIVQSEISGGGTSITGNYTTEEASDFATILKTGNLPLKIEIIAKENVPPQH